MAAKGERIQPRRGKGGRDSGQLSFIPLTKGQPSGRGTTGEGHPEQKRKPISKTAPAKPKTTSSERSGYPQYNFSKPVVEYVHQAEQVSSCAECGRELPAEHRQGYEGHHRIPRHIANKMNMPAELAKSPANCQVLCPTCHTQEEMRLKDPRHLMLVLGQVLYRATTLGYFLSPNVLRHIEEVVETTDFNRLHGIPQLNLAGILQGSLF